MNPQQNNWRYILIVIIVTIIAGDGILIFEKSIAEEIVSLSRPLEIKDFSHLDETDSWQVYRDEECKFEIRFPSDWELIAEEQNLIAFRPKDWTKDKEKEQELGPTAACKPRLPEYIVSIESKQLDGEQDYFEFLSQLGAEQLKKESFGLPTGTWVIYGRQGVPSELKEVLAGREMALRGTRFIGIYYEETEDCPGGYAGMMGVETVILKDPLARCVFLFELLRPEGYSEVFGQLLASFRFVE